MQRCFLLPTQIIKRDGSIVSFDIGKITWAIKKCMSASNTFTEGNLSKVFSTVLVYLNDISEIPTVENIQEIVQLSLYDTGFENESVSYVLYKERKTELRKERPIPEDVKNIFNDSAMYFKTPLQLFQYFDKYSRYDPIKGRRESWIETVDRTVNFLKELSHNKLEESIYERIRTGILNLDVMCSMRLLATAGEAARRNNLAIYNCSYLVIDSIDAFVEVMVISMSGTGVGYQVGKENVSKLPIICHQSGMPVLNHVVADSSEGWAHAFRIGLLAWFAGNDVVFDYSFVRPAGAILKTKGGRASGPAPLKKLLDFVRSRILSKQGMQLSSLDVHDVICMIADASVMGSHRRSALICLFDTDDIEMRECKNGDFEELNAQRWNANNSSNWSEYGISENQFLEQMDSMFDGKRGEPGIVNQCAIKTTIPLRRRFVPNMGVNPCITGDTLVYVADGRGNIAIKDLAVEGKDVPVFCSDFEGKTTVRTMRNPRITGYQQPIYKIMLDDGNVLKTTGNHKFRLITGEYREVSRLKEGDSLALLTRFESSIKDLIDSNNKNISSDEIWLDNGDTHINVERLLIDGFHEMTNEGLQPHALALTKQLEKRFSYIQWMDYAKSHQLPQQFSKWRKDHLGSINGLAKWAALELGYDYIESDPHVVEIYRKLSKDGYDCLIENNSVFINKRCEYCQEVLKVTAIQREISVCSVVCSNKIASFRNLKSNTTHNYKIVSVELCGYEDVYNGTVDEFHNFFIGGFFNTMENGKTKWMYVNNLQCGEIVLRSEQVCNLTQCIVRDTDSIAILLDKVELATIIGTIQALATDFKGVRESWKQNCEEERLLGVDLNGLLDNISLLDGKVLSSLKEHAIHVNKKYAKLLGINESTAITCNKPAGNSSLMLNCASGIHPRWSPYYIRNVRINKYTPMYKVLKDAGVPMVPENGQTKDNAVTWVIQFPVKSPSNAIFRNNLSFKEHAEIWKLCKTFWTEHNPSVTLQYKESEKKDVLEWTWENKDILGGVSFLPASDAKYENQPYVEITEEEYIRRNNEFPTIDFSKLYRYEFEDTTEAAQQLACVAGNCEL